MPWDPDRYQQFKAERAAPFDDLIGMISIQPNMRVIDLGCGPGDLTRRLADLLPRSDVLGIDTSEEMLRRAQAEVRPGLRFEQARLEEITGEWDLVFSHAAIQWVDNHSALVPRLLKLARPGGRLAVQVPSNRSHPSQALLRQAAAEEPFRSAVQGWNREPTVLSIEAYAQLLWDHGVTEMTVFEKVYPHVLPDADAIVEWMAGTALIPYFERLPAGLHEAFLQRYRELVRDQWPDKPVFYGFRRTLFAATRPAGQGP